MSDVGHIEKYLGIGMEIQNALHLPSTKAAHVRRRT